MAYRVLSAALLTTSIALHEGSTTCKSCGEVDEVGLLQHLAVDPETPALGYCTWPLPCSKELVPFTFLKLSSPPINTGQPLEYQSIIGGSNISLWGTDIPNSGCSVQGSGKSIMCNHRPTDAIPDEQQFTLVEAGTKNGSHWFALKASNGKYCGVSWLDGVVRCKYSQVGRCQKFELDMKRYPFLNGLRNPCGKALCRLGLDRLLRCDRRKGDGGSLYLSCENCRSNCTDVAAYQEKCRSLEKHGICYGGAPAPCAKRRSLEAHASCCACGGGTASGSIGKWRPQIIDPLTADRRKGEGSFTCPKNTLESPEYVGAGGRNPFAGGAQVALWGVELVNPGCSYEGCENEVVCKHNTSKILETHRQKFTWVEAGYEADPWDRRYFALQASNGLYCSVDADAKRNLTGGVLRCNKKTVGPCEKFWVNSYNAPFHIISIGSRCDSADWDVRNCDITPSRQFECKAGSQVRIFISCEAGCREECTDTSTDANEWANGETTCKGEGCSPGRGWTCEAYRKNGWCYGGSVTPCFRDRSGPAYNSPEKHCCICGGGTDAHVPNPDPYRPVGGSVFPDFYPPKCWEDGQTCPPSPEPSAPLLPADTSFFNYMGGAKISLNTADYGNLRGCSTDGGSDNRLWCAVPTAAARQFRFTLVDAGARPFDGRRLWALQAPNGLYCGIGDLPEPDRINCNRKTVSQCEMFLQDEYSRFPIAGLESQCNSPNVDAGTCKVSKTGVVSCSEVGQWFEWWIYCEEDCGDVCEDTPGWTNGWDCQADGYGAEDGCAPGGWTCAGYQKHGWCFGGSVPTCSANMSGQAHNYPEKNCCLCGGGTRSFPTPAPTPAPTLPPPPTPAPAPPPTPP